MRIFALFVLLIAAASPSLAQDPLASASRAAHDLLSTYYSAPLCSRNKVSDSARAHLAEALSALSTVGLSDATGLSPVHYAALADDVAAIERFRSIGYSLDAADIHGGTPLYSAVLVGSQRALRHLIAAGANPEARTGTGATPLFVAAAENNLQLTSILIDAGASAATRATDGSTALHHAIACKDPQLIEAILQAGAPLDERAKRLAERLGVWLPPDVR